VHIAQATHFSDQAERRSQGYWLLAKLFLEVPTPDRLRALHDVLAPLSETPGPLQAAIAGLLTAVGQALSAPEATAVDFTRRLIVVDKESDEALPFEAHARERRLPGDATEAMQLLTAECGYFDVAPEAASLDHLGAELRLMALLCHDECQAWTTGALDAAVASLRRQKRLLGSHLEQWAPDFCRGLADRSGNAYVQAMARLTGQALAEDAQMLAELVGEVDALLTRPVQ
jgi:TorA maturation chaperone TorD